MLNGKWDHAHTMLVGPRVREGVHGVHVITPLVRENGSTILVDRGFVSNERIADAAFRNELGEATIFGLLRTSQPRNYFTPNNEPEKGKWYWSDVPAMAEYAGGVASDVQEVFVEQIFGTFLSKGMLYIHGFFRGPRGRGKYQAIQRHANRTCANCRYPKYSSFLRHNMVRSLEWYRRSMNKFGIGIPCRR